MVQFAVCISFRSSVEPLCMEFNYFLEQLTGFTFLDFFVLFAFAVFDCCRLQWSAVQLVHGVPGFHQLIYQLPGADHFGADSHFSQFFSSSTIF